MEERLMTVKEVARYLSVNERTVLKLVQDATLPGVKVGNQWRFRRAIIDTWLDDQMLGISPRIVESPRLESATRMLTLSSCFQRAHIVPELEPRTKSAVIVELARHAQKLGLIRDETWFVGALIQRDNLMPSAVGNGLAFLHTVKRHPDQVIRPFLVLGRSRAGIDCGALDGRPTHLFFVLGLKYEELHLPWLAKVVQMLAQADVVESLLKASDPSAIYDVLARAEDKLTPAVAASG